MKDYVEKHNLGTFCVSFDLNCVSFRQNKKKYCPPTGTCNRVTRPSWGWQFFPKPEVSPPSGSCNPITSTSWGGDKFFFISANKFRYLSQMMPQKGLNYVFRFNLSYFFPHKIVDDHEIDFFLFLKIFRWIFALAVKFFPSDGIRPRPDSGPPTFFSTNQVRWISTA